MQEVDELSVGEVGYVIANIKRVADTKIGDTITEDARPTLEPFPGFQEVKPMVFAGLYPTDNADYEALRDALAKLQLNDSSFFYEPDTSGALGFGFRCGFLGLLHMEIVQERLEREFNLSLITTAPGVRYRDHDQERGSHSKSIILPNCRRSGDIAQIRRAHHHGHDSYQRRICRARSSSSRKRSVECKKDSNT